MFILIGTSPGMGIIARWGPLPVSMVLRSKESLKSAEMLSLPRTSKYVKNTSVLGIKKSEKDSLRPKGLIKLDSYCSDKLIFMLSGR